MTRLTIIFLLLLSGFLLPLTAMGGSHSKRRENNRQSHVYVVLWFDTEDYIVPQSDDAAKRIAETLTRLGVKATFKVVGEKARVLENRGRRDVINALLKHEIGYHSNTHSQQPTIAVYLQNLGWDDGAAEFLRREGQGVKDIERIFGVLPTCYGQPGNSWAPQAYPALRSLGIQIYLDEADHVGIEDQPFYYCGMLNVFKMRSNLARFELNGGESLPEAKERVKRIYERLRASGGGTISIYYHPTEFINRQFWDAANFARGRNPPRSQWQFPEAKTEAESEKGYRDFEAYVAFIKSLPDLSFVTASDLAMSYADLSANKDYTDYELHKLAGKLQEEITFQRIGQASLSAADLFALFNNALASYLDKGRVDSTYRMSEGLYGPARQFVQAINNQKLSQISWEDFAAATRDVQSYCQRHGRIPDEVWLGTRNISPEDYLATLAAVMEEILSKNSHREFVQIHQGRLIAERYVAEDSPELWNWAIFPEGFHSSGIMRLAKLQAWTIKPAILHKL